MIRTKKIAVYEKYFKYLIVFIVSIFTILNFLSQRSFERDIANNDIKLNNCEYFIFVPLVIYFFKKTEHLE